MKKFSWKKFAEVILDEYSDDKKGLDDFIEELSFSWINDCIGKTPDEIRRMRYCYKDDWLKEGE